MMMIMNRFGASPSVSGEEEDMGGDGRNVYY